MGGSSDCSKKSGWWLCKSGWRPLAFCASLSAFAALLFALGSSSALAQASGPVAAYGLNEGTGTTTVDVSGNNITGTLSATTWAVGHSGNALRFNGSSSFVNLGNPAALQITGSMTISAWINSSAFPGDDAAIVSRRNNGSLGFQLDTTVDRGPRTIGFKLTGSGGANMARYGATAMVTNTWYYVTGVYNAAAQTMNVYLNGVLDNGTLLGTVTASQQVGTQNVNFGRRTGLSGFAFNGLIDEVRIYNRALTQAEIQTDMVTPVGSTPPPPDTTPPSAPGTLSATAPGSAIQINLAWGAASDNVGVTGYRVERCQGAGCTTFTQIATPTAASFNDTTVSSSTSYSYQVRAVDAAGNLGPYSNVASATTPATPDTTPPSAPSVISAVVVSASEIDLSWTASTDNVAVTGYQVDRCLGAACANFVQIAISGPAYNDLGLAASSTYRYRVRAFDAAGNVSANSSIVNATTLAVPDTTPPSAPSTLIFGSSTTTQITMAWLAATDNVAVTSYLVERCLAASCSFAQVATTSATILTDTGLAPGTSYNYRVRATDAAGNLGPYSNTALGITQPTDTTPPSAPGQLSISANVGSTQINLVWGDASDNLGVTGYRLERCQGSGCTNFTEIAQIAPTTTSFADTGLTPNTSYSYRVRAVDAAGNFGPYTNIVSATTAAVPSGLVAAYAFNEGSGTTTADASGNNITGTLNATTWAAGAHDNALRFNGSSSFVDLGNPAALQISGSMTISAWINSSVFPADDAAIVSRRNSGNLGFQLDTTVDRGPRTIGFKLTSSTGANMARYGATAMLPNTWYYVAGVYDAAAQTMNVYLNGVLDNGTLLGTVTASQQVGTQNVNFGRRTGLSGFAFNGLIDDVRIYNRALLQTEILSDMSRSAGTLPPIDTTPPSAPGALTATAINSTRIDLSWTASTDNVGVTKYYVWRCPDAGSCPNLQIGQPVLTSFSDTNLTPGTTYFYVVAAADLMENQSALSNIASATTPATPDTTPPSAPSVISAVVVSASEIDLSWTASTDNVAVTGYQVDRCLGAACTNFVQVATSAGPAFNNPGLAGSSTYRYRVRAFDAAGNVSANSSIVNATTLAVPDTTPPTVPTGLTATATSPTQVVLAWIASTDNVGVTGYQLQRCIGTCGWVDIGTTTATSFTDSGLAPATTYKYWVRAVDAAGNLSGWSTIVPVTTPSPDATPPSAPGALSATASGSSQINLAWSAATDDVGVTGYRVERCSGASCTTFAQIATPTATSFSDTGLTANTSYSYQVRAVDAAGNLGPYSNIASAVTAAGPSGLVAAYGFNEGTGTTTADMSGNNINGTLAGATWGAGKFGNAIVFNGSSSFVDLGNPPQLQIVGSMTISAWINAAAFPGDDAAVVSKRTGSSELGFQLDTTVDRGPRTVGFKLTSASGPVMARYGATALQTNTWYFITGVYDATAQTMSVYVNGVLDNGALVGTVSTTQQLSTLNVNVGQRPGAGGFGFIGTIDEVRIYNRALTQAEIQSDMASPVVAQSGGPDTIPPTVAIVTPTANAALAGTVAVSAAAADNAGLSNVQFLLDGAPFKSPVAAPGPYTLLWNTNETATGPHVLSAVATDQAGNSATAVQIPVTVQAPTAAMVQSGLWSGPFPWTNFVAVHMSLTSNGQVITWDGEDAGLMSARLWNPATGIAALVPNTRNLFCSGHDIAPDGRVLVVGGHQQDGIGIPDLNYFDPVAGTWTAAAAMSFARWYPTATGLPDGRTLVVSGSIDCETCIADTPEIYNPATNSWQQLSAPTAKLALPLYPHMFVIPDGRVVAAGSQMDKIVSQVLDISAQTWTPFGGSTAVNGGSSVMYQPGKIMKSGLGRAPDLPVIASVRTTSVLDATQASPVWRTTGQMAFARNQHNLTLLPDGTVLVTGGGTNSDLNNLAGAVLAAELWSPTTETWTTLASMSTPRLYHSTALLLPDGRVLSSGSGRTGVDQMDYEIFSPPYLFKGPRPTIASAPTDVQYGTSFDVQTPDASRVATVSLIRLGSVTHSINMGQRYQSLPFQVGAGTLTVQAPDNGNIAPPGFYMLFILDGNGIPSVASILRVH